MRTATMVVLAAVVGINVMVAGCAKNVSDRRAASPTMSERVSHDAVIGQVKDIGSKHVSIKDRDGESRRVRVDDQTKMDQVAIGDQVKAYVTEDGYASTIQRVTSQ